MYITVVGGGGEGLKKLSKKKLPTIYTCVWNYTIASRKVKVFLGGSHLSSDRDRLSHNLVTSGSMREILGRGASLKFRARSCLGNFDISV